MNPREPEGWIDWSVRGARRAAVALVGGTVLLIGVAMMVLPGPAIVVIPIGLGILGLEFAWARNWLRRVKEHAENTFGKSGAAANAPPTPVDAPTAASDAGARDGH